MICILAPTEKDLMHLLGKAHINCKRIYALGVIYETILCGKNVLFVCTGYNKINLGIACGYVLSIYDISCIIGVGNCGYIGNDNISIGDVAIVSSSLQYDVNSSAIGYPKTVIPDVGLGVFNSTAELVNLSKKSCEQLRYNYSIGRAATGEAFIADREERNYIAREYCTEFIDMECGGLGEVAYIFKISSVFIKGISNYADIFACKDYKQYVDCATEKANKVVSKLIEIL